MKVPHVVVVTAAWGHDRTSHSRTVARWLGGVRGCTCCRAAAELLTGARSCIGPKLCGQQHDAWGAQSCRARPHVRAAVDPCGASDHGWQACPLDGWVCLRHFSGTWLAEGADGRRWNRLASLPLGRCVVFAITRATLVRAGADSSDRRSEGVSSSYAGGPAGACRRTATLTALVTSLPPHPPTRWLLSPLARITFIAAAAPLTQPRHPGTNSQHGEHGRRASWRCPSRAGS